MPLPNTANLHLPPHLREVCALLARGLVRLRSRTAEQTGLQAVDHGERRLDFLPTQRGHAKPTRRKA